jgi:hypothetical protein
MERSYMYVFVREDLSSPQQIVQSSHASARIGELFHSDTNIVLIGVRNEDHLKTVAGHLECSEIQYHMFYEPDIDGYTAIALEPLMGEKRKPMKKYQTLKESPLLSR